jgi:hypothetical protein
MAFEMENYEKTVEFYKEKGRPVLQGGTWEGLTYTYLDSCNDLGLIAEFCKLVFDFIWPEPDSVDTVI